MPSYSIVMLVSRSDMLLDECIKRLELQVPDRFIFGIKKELDPDTKQVIRKKLKKLEKVSETLILEQNLAPYPFSHCVNYSDMIDYVKTDWVRLCDDDDWMIGDTEELIEEASPGYRDFLIYGNKLVRILDRGGYSFFVRPGLMESPKDANQYVGSTGIFRTKYIRGVHRHNGPGPSGDWRAVYALLKKGLTSCYIDRTICVQITSLTEQRRKYRGITWDLIYKHLEDGTFSRWYDKLRREFEKKRRYRTV